MPRLYFDFADGNVVSEGDTGVDLPDAEKARQDASVPRKYEMIGGVSVAMSLKR